MTERMDAEQQDKSNVRFYAYVLIYSLLALPLLLPPLALFFDLEPLFGMDIGNNRIVSIGIMLLVATVADSIFAGVNSLRQMLIHIVWVALAVAVMPTVLQAGNSIYLLGLMFFIHSFRSSSQLWYGSSSGWLWPAWLRDISMAMIIFLWLILSPSWT